MARMQIAAWLAALALSTPALAFDPADADSSTVFYVSIPLDGGLARKDRVPVFGLRLQGKREYETLRIDTKLLNLLPGAAAIEAKWIVAGVLAAGAAVALGSRDKGTAQALNAQQAQTQQQQQQQQQQRQQPCPQTPACR
ncbi:MAG: hypothetical protein EPO20_08545 [Betaproteobacteria bacterium]|nr:MAG: hypothetical protein EPO20_08545 [Betaproteobacteria bacterium]